MSSSPHTVLGAVRTPLVVNFGFLYSGHIFPYTRTPLLPPPRTPSQRLRRGIIRLGVAEPAAAVARLRDDGARAFARVEPATSRRTVRVAQALACDELRAGAGADVGGPGGVAVDRARTRICGRGRRRRSWCGDKSVCGRWRRSATTGQSTRGVVVGLGITEAAAAVAFLGYHGTGAFAAVEAAAAGGAVGVAGAGACNELRALGDDEECYCYW